MKLSARSLERIISSLKFQNGLVTAVVRDYRTKEVLMVASQNREAVKRTLLEGRMYYWSKSRRKLWMKGEESGHLQFLKRAYLDCDGDSVLYDVKQAGGACHEGYRSCFFREIKNGTLKVVGKRVFDPKKVYSSE